MKTIQTMTRAEFDTLPRRKWDKDIGPFDSLVILPDRKRHDSGYRLLDFVACRGDRPVCLLSGCSDVVHIDGVGGFGKWSPDTGLPRSLPPKGWAIDCLPTSGLLRLFASHNALTCGPALSSFDVYATPEAAK